MPPSRPCLNVFQYSLCIREAFPGKQFLIGHILVTHDEKLVFLVPGDLAHLAQDLGPRWHPADLAAPPSSPPTPTFSAHRQTLLWAKALQKAAQDLHVLKKLLLFWVTIF